MSVTRSTNIEQLVKAVQSLRRGEGDGAAVEADSYKALADNLKAALGSDDQFEPLFKELEALDADGVARVANFLIDRGFLEIAKKGPRQDTRDGNRIAANTTRQTACHGRAALQRECGLPRGHQYPC